jgi:hypothetical protein
MRNIRTRNFEVACILITDQLCQTDNHKTSSDGPRCNHIESDEEGEEKWKEMQ